MKIKRIQRKDVGKFAHAKQPKYPTFRTFGNGFDLIEARMLFVYDDDVNRPCSPTSSSNLLASILNSGYSLPLRHSFWRIIGPNGTN